jgi:hypothetical protein
MHVFTPFFFSSIFAVLFFCPGGVVLAERKVGALSGESLKRSQQITENSWQAQRHGTFSVRVAIPIGTTFERNESREPGDQYDAAAKR